MCLVLGHIGDSTWSKTWTKNEIIPVRPLTLRNGMTYPSVRRAADLSISDICFFTEVISGIGNQSAEQTEETRAHSISIDINFLI